MNRYEPETPRAAMGVVAIAMAALSAAMFVIVPAKLESMRVDASMQTAVRESADEEDAEAAHLSASHPLSTKHASARVEPRLGRGTVEMERGN